MAEHDTTIHAINADFSLFNGATVSVRF